jgi:hypothetical protein
MENISMGSNRVLRREFMKPDFVRLSRSIVAAGVAGLMMMGCDSSTGPQELDAVTVKTSSSVIPVQIVDGARTATISSTVTNSTGATVYFISYCSPQILRSSGNTFTQVWSVNCAAIDGVPTELKAGQSTSLSVTVSSRGSQSLPAFDFGGTGTPFRISIGFYTQSPPLTVSKSRQSNTFFFAQ